MTKLLFKNLNLLHIFERKYSLYYIKNIKFFIHPVYLNNDDRVKISRFETSLKDEMFEDFMSTVYSHKN